MDPVARPKVAPLRRPGDAPLPPQRNKLGAVLLEKGLLDQAGLERALALQVEGEKTGRRFAEILVEDLHLDRNLVYGEQARLYAFREVDLQAETLDEDRLEFIRKLMDDLPAKVKDGLVEKLAIPLTLAPGQKDLLLVVTPDPTDRDVPALVRVLPYARYELLYAHRAQVQDLMARVMHSRNEFLEIVDAASQIEEVIETGGDVDEDALEAEIHQGRLTGLVEGMLVEATRKGVSDIHMIPAPGNRAQIYFRLDGKLQLWTEQQNTKPEAISAVVKDRSRNVDRFERESAQDGFIQRKINDHYIRFRVSILPIVGAEFDRKIESIVIRVLDDRKVITDLGKLGLQAKAQEDFRSAIQSPQGMVILTGPTGSGKSTTLVAALYSVMTPEKNCLTVEDPVEYMIEGARQIKLSHRLDFDQAVRAILRHDPDIVMVGEIRDLKTAEIAIKMANTGHLTFSTLHTNDAASVISRLFKMGVEPFLMANAINIVVAQRLVRTICQTARSRWRWAPRCRWPWDSARRSTSRPPSSMRGPAAPSATAAGRGAPASTRRCSSRRKSAASSSTRGRRSMKSRS